MDRVYKNTTYKLGDLENILFELEEFACVPDSVIESDETHKIVIGNWYVNVPALDFHLYDGVFFSYDAKEQDYMPDFSITMIKKAGTDAYLYYEQGGFVSALGNYLNREQKQDLKLGALSELSCQICIPE